MIAPGSFVVISHATHDEVSGEEYAAGVSVYQNASAPVVPRRYEQVREFFNGLDMVAPGLVSISRWRASGQRSRPLVYGGVGCHRLTTRPEQPRARARPGRQRHAGGGR